MQTHAQIQKQIHAQIQKQIHCTNTEINTWTNTWTNTDTNTETKATALCRNSSWDEETVICFGGRVRSGEVMIFTCNAMQCNLVKMRMM